MAAIMNQITFIFQRKAVEVISSKIICTNVNFPTFLHTSIPMLAEPLKKKKKMDPAVIKAREERRKKRIEKSIKKLERNTKQLKPLEEIDLPIVLQKEKWLRNRTEDCKQATLEDPQILKAWCHYKYQQHFLEMKMIDRIMNSQSKALEQLRNISEDLYVSAIQVDDSLVPFSAIGPHHTPPISSYEALDGDYIDETPKWN